MYISTTLVNNLHLHFTNFTNSHHRFCIISPRLSCFPLAGQCLVLLPCQLSKLLHDLLPHLIPVLIFHKIIDIRIDHHILWQTATHEFKIAVSPFFCIISDLLCRYECLAEFLTYIQQDKRTVSEPYKINIFQPSIPGVYFHKS